jgi:hypothetical protein
LWDVPDATHRNFQNFVFAGVKASHLTVDPYQRSIVEVQGFLHSRMQWAARNSVCLQMRQSGRIKPSICKASVKRQNTRCPKYR